MNASRTSALRLMRPALSRSSKLSPRNFTTLTPLRPSLAARPSLAIRPNTTSFTPTTPEAADVVPRSAISAHPALAGGAGQVRCGPRNTMNGHTRLVQKRRHGFLKRMRSRTGRKIIMRRKLKGRRHVGW